MLEQHQRQQGRGEGVEESDASMQQSSTIAGNSHVGGTHSSSSGSVESITQPAEQPFKNVSMSDMFANMEAGDDDDDDCSDDDDDDDSSSAMGKILDISSFRRHSKQSNASTHTDDDNNDSSDKNKDGNNDNEKDEKPCDDDNESDSFTSHTTSDEKMTVAPLLSRALSTFKPVSISAMLGRDGDGADDDTEGTGTGTGTDTTVGGGGGDKGRTLTQTQEGGGQQQQQPAAPLSTSPLPPAGKSASVHWSPCTCLSLLFVLFRLLDL